MKKITTQAFKISFIRLLACAGGVLLFWIVPQVAKAQTTGPPPNTIQRPSVPPVYLLNLTPKKGGKPYTLFRNTKVHATLSNGTAVTGKVRTISKDSIYIENRYYALNDITEFRFNPGTVLGAAAAIGACAGIATIAITAGGGKDGVRSDTENIAFWSGVGVTTVSLALLVPNYFVKKKFSRTKYDFRIVQIGGY